MHIWCNGLAFLPSKQTVRVRISLYALIWLRGVIGLSRHPVTVKIAGSSPVVVVFAELTQLGECFPYKEEVEGSSPLFRTAGCGGHKTFS